MSEEEHVKQFLNSSTFNQLSANQQKHAQAILTRFNSFMNDEQHLADTAWTPQAVQQVMVGQFIADPDLTNSFGIAVAPVLKAYQRFLKVDNLSELEQAIDDQRATMNECRKSHQTLQELNGKGSKSPKATSKKAPAKKAKTSKKGSTAKKATTKKAVPQSTSHPLSAADLSALVDEVKQAVLEAPEFQDQALNSADQQYLVTQFLTLINQECHQRPNEWQFNDLQMVLGMMMPLDPNITKSEIENIVPTAQALFEYLKRTGHIEMDQYKVGLKAIANMQNSQNVLALMNRKERQTQLMMSYIRSQGVDIDDVKKTDKWMDEHRTEVADFMKTILKPWSAYERQQLKHQQRGQQLQQGARDQQLRHKKRVPQGIKFSKKLRRRLRRHK